MSSPSSKYTRGFGPGNQTFNMPKNSGSRLGPGGRPAYTTVYDKVLNDPYLFHKILLTNVHEELHQILASAKIWRTGSVCRDLRWIYRIDARVAIVHNLPMQLREEFTSPNPCSLCRQECVEAGFEAFDRFSSMQIWPCDRLAQMQGYDGTNPHLPDPYDYMKKLALCDPCLALFPQLCDGLSVHIHGNCQLWKVDSVNREND